MPKFLILAVVLLLLIVSVWFFMQNQGSRTSDITADTPVGVLPNLTGGDGEKCVYTYEDEDGSVNTMTVYTDINTNRMRGTAVNNIHPGSFESLYTGGYNYVWGNDGTQTGGTRIYVGDKTLDEFEVEYSNQTAQYTTEGPEPDCSSWRVDESVFAVPGNIRFVDGPSYDQTMQMQDMFEGMSADMTPEEMQALYESTMGQ